MTRNERIEQKARAILSAIHGRTKWVSVEVAPGHSVTAPFTTLDPRDRENVDQLCREIIDETNGTKT